MGKIFIFLITSSKKCRLCDQIAYDGCQPTYTKNVLYTYTVPPNFDFQPKQDLCSLCLTDQTAHTKLLDKDEPRS
jgi:hypothetical protein